MLKWPAGDSSWARSSALELEVLAFFHGQWSGRERYFQPRLTTPPPDNESINAATSRLASIGLMGINRAWVPGDQGWPVGLTVYGHDYLRDSAALGARAGASAGRVSHRIVEGAVGDTNHVVRVANTLLHEFKPRPTQ